FMLEYLNIDGSTSGHHILNADKDKIINFFKRFTFTVNGTQSIEKAFVTGGGVNLKEIHPSTMSSKIIDGLHFAREVLDIHGYTGGYKITSALVTGYTAGFHASHKYNDLGILKFKIPKSYFFDLTELIIISNTFS